ncbi:hypothetical protein PLICRDRAFT_108348 [Plicaturopsis crispa FD-325 SS-3]|nr:hypothetical protein PLICRDRAFT_108348 [Plicaturopsis crispa FD-325 SS-3]
MASAAASGPFTFSSPAGYDLCRQILSKSLPFDPHDYQLEGICKALDGNNLVALTSTGSGKSGFFYMYMLVVLAITKNPSLCPSVRFPEDPAMVIICPTNFLEEQMRMHAMGLNALAINAVQIGKAQELGENLWEKARAGVSMILLSPEQLSSSDFERLLQDKKFWFRVCAMSVDEVHLMNTWGKGFRKHFHQVGFTKERLREIGLIVMLVSATLRSGEPMQAVLNFMGLREGGFHFIRRSNMRYEIQPLFRELKSGIQGLYFPELAWILRDGRKTVIFASTINYGFRLQVYLTRIAPISPPTNIRIRLYNSLNWEDFNAESKRLFEEDPRCQILIATKTLSVGVDLSNVEDVVNADLPDDIDEYAQMAGRAGRNKKVVKDPRVITYVPLNLVTALAKKDGRGASDPTASLDPSIVALITAQCKVREQERQYENPLNETPCQCRSCKENPPTPRPALCSCSGCKPEPLDPRDETEKAKRVTGVTDVPKSKRITGEMRSHAPESVAKLQMIQS